MKWLNRFVLGGVVLLVSSLTLTAQPLPKEEIGAVFRAVSRVVGRNLITSPSYSFPPQHLLSHPYSTLVKREFESRQQNSLSPIYRNTTCPLNYTIRRISFLSFIKGQNPFFSKETQSAVPILEKDMIKLEEERGIRQKSLREKIAYLSQELQIPEPEYDSLEGLSKHMEANCETTLERLGFHDMKEALVEYRSMVAKISQAKAPWRLRASFDFMEDFKTAEYILSQKLQKELLKNNMLNSKQTLEFILVQRKISLLERFSLAKLRGTF